VGAAYRSLLNEESDYSCYVGPEYMDRLQPGLPDLMLLNKQILVEGLQQFHRTATFFQMNDIDNPLRDKAKPLSLLRLYQARVVDLTYNDRCFLNTWEETGVDGKKILRLRDATRGRSDQQASSIPPSVFTCAPDLDPRSLLRYIQL
jgi:hypothetical protein